MWGGTATGRSTFAPPPIILMQATSQSSLEGAAPALAHSLLPQAVAAAGPTRTCNVTP